MYTFSPLRGETKPRDPMSEASSPAKDLPIESKFNFTTSKVTNSYKPSKAGEVDSVDPSIMQTASLINFRAVQRTSHEKGLSSYEISPSKIGSEQISQSIKNIDSPPDTAYLRRRARNSMQVQT